MNILTQDDLKDFKKRDDNNSRNWSKISGTVDSGAVTIVMNRKVADWVPIQPNEASRTKRWYTGASGDKIYNEGEKVLEGLTKKGVAVAKKFQIAEVDRPLFAVRDFKKAGNIVAFGLGEEHAIINMNTGRIYAKKGDDVIVSKQDGEQIDIGDDGKEYSLDMWIKQPANKSASSFHRQP